MGQLMDLHRLSLEKGGDPTTKQRDALAESQALFLTNQARSQAATERVAELVRHKRELFQDASALEEQLRLARAPADEEYERLDGRHDFLLACLKLGLLIPLLAFVAGVPTGTVASASWPSGCLPWWRPSSMSRWSCTSTSPATSSSTSPSLPAS